MKQDLFSFRARLTSVALASLALAVVPAASAQAALIATSACDGAKLTQPFIPWADSGFYKLAPGGDFEGGLGGWTVTGGARAVTGSEPYAATGSAGSSSLYLPVGASAQSPFTCVNAAYPTIRFFARGGGLASSVLVQVVYRDPALGQVLIPVGIAGLSGSWRPTLPMLTGSAIQGALSGGTAQVALRFTALTGSSQLDDVFVDPRMC